MIDNTFDYRLFIDEVPYSISVDSSDGDRKRIVVNRTVVFDDVCAGFLPPTTDILYFPFVIKNKRIVISIDDREIQHKYNIYVNDVSPIDGSSVYGDLNKAKADVSGGFFGFIKRKWKKILLENLALMVAGYFAFREFKKWEFYIAFIVICLVAIVLAEWLSAKSIIKKFNRRYKIKKKIIVK